VYTQGNSKKWHTVSHEHNKKVVGIRTGQSARSSRNICDRRTTVAAPAP
jgi:hypothetical protein